MTSVPSHVHHRPTQGILRVREPGEHDDGHDAPVRESGHPLRHVFTRSIPTAQCMNCHMHQPNIFLNSFLGYTMWDYEADAPAMWPAQQRYPTAEEVRHALLLLTTTIGFPTVVAALSWADDVIDKQRSKPLAV